MDMLLYWLARSFVALLQSLPLRWVAFFGRVAGGLAFHIDARHRRVVLLNLRRVFASEMTEPEIYAIARENFKRIGESYTSAIRTSGMGYEEARQICEVVGLEKLAPRPGEESNENRIVAIGHFGNFELNAILAKGLPGYQGATTYRGVRPPSLNRLLQEVRGNSGCLYFERRTEAAELRSELVKRGVLLGLLADQHAGNGGLWIPFLGHDCSTSAAPAVFALRYNAPLFTAIIYRVSLGRWRAEVGDEIPTRVDGKPRASREIALDMNRAFEKAVRRDPANWFWVHQRWKVRPRALRSDASGEDEAVESSVAPV